MSKPWLNQQRDGTWEINPQQERVRINIGTNENVEVDKLYGPLAAHPVRIRLEYNNDVSDWVVERQSFEGDHWIEMARWDCQLGFEELGDGGATEPVSSSVAP